MPALLSYEVMRMELTTESVAKLFFSQIKMRSIQAHNTVASYTSSVTVPDSVELAAC